MGFQDQQTRPMYHQQINKWKQNTILWHVDVLKVSHVEKNVVEYIPKQLKHSWQTEASTRVFWV